MVGEETGKGELELSKIREECERRVREDSERAALGLAQFKQEMHLEINGKEATIAELRRIVHESDQKGDCSLLPGCRRVGCVNGPMQRRRVEAEI